MLTSFHNRQQQQWTKWSLCVFPAKAGDTHKRKCSCHMPNCVFLCNLIIFYWKIKLLSFFGNHIISKWPNLKRGLFLTYFLHFKSPEKTHKFLQQISNLHTYAYVAHPIDLFCFSNFAKIVNLLYTVSLWCDSWCWFLFTPLWSNQ